MSEERFTTDYSDLLKNAKTFIKMDNERLTYEEVVDLLNELNDERMMYKTTIDKRIVELEEENEQLKQKIQRWKTLYEIKDKEVTARVKRLNEICNRYKYAITFDKDIDPNDAVNILCDKILQTEVEMMSDCDNCIYTHYINNEWFCIMGNRPNKECEDYHHWNRLTDEEKGEK